MTMGLPDVRLVWSGAHLERCIICGRNWPMQDIPVPGVYTATSVDQGDVPEPICDHCVEEQDPVLFAEMLAERRRFHAS